MRCLFIQFKIEDKENNGTRNFLEAQGIVTFCHEVLCSTKHAIKFARNNNLIKNEMVCKYGFSMSLVKKIDCSLGEIWRCKICYAKISIRFCSLLSTSIYLISIHNLFCIPEYH